VLELYETGSNKVKLSKVGSNAIVPGPNKFKNLINLVVVCCHLGYPPLCSQLNCCNIPSLECYSSTGVQDRTRDCDAARNSSKNSSFMIIFFSLGKKNIITQEFVQILGGFFR
jgi:hypothetical protein